MKLSSRVRYGLRALVELADIQADTPVLLETVAQRQGLSRKYLDAIFARLKSAGLLRSSRGVGGGFLLGKPAAQITLAEVYQALEGPIQLADCLADATECSRRDSCPTVEVWADMSRILHQYLSGITVDDLVQKRRRRLAEGGSMFFI